MRCFITLVICLCSLASFGQIAGPSEPGPAGVVKNQKKDEPQKEKPKKEKTNKQSKLRLPTSNQHVYATVYMFGISTQLGDSTQYITSIAQIDGADLTQKTKFLTFRESYGYQLRNYIEGTLGKKGQTTAIFFDVKQSRLQKRFSKMINKALDREGVQLVTINPEEFIFRSVEATLQQ